MLTDSGEEGVSTPVGAWRIVGLVYHQTMVDQIRAQLLPKLSDIIDSLGDESDEIVSIFFAGIRDQLVEVESEAELIGPFLQLAGTAPVVNAAGVDPRVLFKIDELLELAQELAHTLSASSQQH